MDLIELLKVLFYSSCIFCGIGTQKPIFVSEKLSRYFLAVTVESELDVVHTVLVFLGFFVALAQSFNLVCYA